MHCSKLMLMPIVSALLRDTVLDYKFEAKQGY